MRSQDGPGLAGRIEPGDRPGEAVRLSEVVSALSYALDITEGQPMGHAVRTGLIGMQIASVLGLSSSQCSALYYALLLKDLGCSSNAARVSSLFGADDRLLKHAFKLTNWRATSDSARYAFKYSLPGRGRIAKAWHMLMLGVKEQGFGREITQTRCERGADIATMLKLPLGSAEAIRTLDEHWDGGGLPYGHRGDAIPLLGRIAGLAQTVEVFQSAFDVATAYEMARARRGRWFDPAIVDALATFEFDEAFWGTLRGAGTLASVRALEPEDQVILCDDTQLDVVAEAFARVIDAKSPYTSRHSQNVAVIAVNAGRAVGLEVDALRTLQRASLLHDIGKLGVSNAILDKPNALDPNEWESMRQHTRYTLEILKRVSRFRQFAGTAAAHHERLDGSGYHLGLHGDQLGTVARLLAVADVTEALSADRPYRAGMPRDEAIPILRNLVGRGHLCADAAAAVEASFTGVVREELYHETLVA
ncbi:MAG TPA: HD domain-containing phosphohydrolase [Gemmatimonadales bacterium]|jgi:putative nucleotidyltransferase with HDIG domain